MIRFAHSAREADNCCILQELDVLLECIRALQQRARERDLLQRSKLRERTGELEVLRERVRALLQRREQLAADNRELEHQLGWDRPVT
jgi:chromosome segregation ATPase